MVELLHANEVEWATGSSRSLIKGCETMEIEIGRLYRAILRFWWLPIVGAVLLGMTAGLVSSALPTNYTATTRMLIVPEDLTGQSVINGSPNMLIDIATSTPVMEQVIEDLGLDMTVEELRGDIVVVMQAGTRILLISVTSNDTEQAVEISNTIAEKTELRADEITINELQGKRDGLEFRSNALRDRLISIDARISVLTESETDDDSQRNAELAALQGERLIVAQEKADIDNSLRGLRAQINMSYSDVSIVEPARVPEEPDGLSIVIVGIIGAFVGGLIGSALILFLALRDRTIINGTQVARITGAPILRDIGRKTFNQDFRMVLRFIGGLRSVEAGAGGSVAIIAPTELPQLDEKAFDEEHSGSELAISNDFHIANGVMANESALTSALQSSGVVIAAAVGVTDESDLRRTVDSLQVAGVPVLGSIIFREN